MSSQSYLCLMTLLWLQSQYYFHLMKEENDDVAAWISYHVLEVMAYQSACK